MKEFKIMPSHILTLDGEQFPVYHVERRLYSFVNWKESRDKIIKVLLARIKAETGENTAFIKFKMANPMRRTRLGKFFLDLVADVSLRGNSLGTVKELGLENIFFCSFETLDSIELQLRTEKEELFADVEYNRELNFRLDKSLGTDHGGVRTYESRQSSIDKVKVMMEKEGWSAKEDNRIFARIKRCKSNES
jgi:hypothetical protein